MVRIIAAAFVLLLAWVFAKDAIFNMAARPSADGFVAEPADYSSVDAWAFRPSAETPGAWERPWGIDVFLVLPAPRDAEGLMVDTASAQAREAFQGEVSVALVERLSGIGAVYAPVYRAPAPAAYRLPGDSDVFERASDAARSDIMSAFDAYLANDNRSRAILFVGLAEGADHLRALEARAAGDPLLMGRTLGYVSLRAPDYAYDPDPLEAQCMQGVERPCLIKAQYKPHLPFTRFFVPSAPVRALPKPEEVISPDLVDRLKLRADRASVWLDANAAKPAPPLPPMESIEIAPVRKPGETDD